MEKKGHVLTLMVNGDDPEGEANRLTKEAACAAKEWLDELKGDPTLAGQAEFCGCHTCIVREVLRAAYPYMMGLVILQFEQGARSVQHVDINGNPERGH